MSNRSTICLILFLASGLYAADAVRVAPRPLPPSEARVNDLAPDLSFTDLAGKSGKLSDFRNRPLVIAFTSLTCPVARKYVNPLAQLQQRYAGKVEFLLVNSSAADTPNRIAEALKQAGLSARAVHDPKALLASALNVQTTTEALLLDSARTIVYRGAVDDQYGLGYQLAAPKHTFLIDAIEAVLAGQTPEIQATTAPGCEIEQPAVAPAVATSTPITFHNRISRIIQANCQECHRAGEPAPFELAAYDDVKSRAKTIKRVVDQKIMPPWYVDHGQWANDRRLTDRDRADLLAWLDAGMPLGQIADAPLPRKWETGWRIGKPDMVFHVPQPIAIQANGAMEYQNVMVLTNLPEDKWVKAVELRTDTPQVTHHILAFEVYPPNHPRDKKERPSHRGGVNGYFAGMVPGQGHTIYPEGTAKLLPKGAAIVLQIHYTPNGRPWKDRPRIGVIFADKKPEHEILTRSVNTTRFEIPAHAENFEITATKTFTEPTRIFSFSPHSHVRGKAFRYELFYPDGRREVVLDMPRYDFNWQFEYRLKDPLDLPIGTKLVVTAWYDNSKNNPANPDPTQIVRFGEQTWDEMMIGYYTRHALPNPATPKSQASSTQPPAALQ